jgi:WD40 repeat protein/transcriptional regulator with XRE-family HTH domain/energy-coupling factor transporter ATP-binding protein EcfA2
MPDQPFSPDSFQTFGDLLKYLRRRERLTQLELSIMVGYSEAQMTRLEKNQRRPDITALKALFIPALHIEDQPELIARLLTLAQSARPEDAPVPGFPPYKGLLFFDEVDSGLFFGRESLTAHLVERISDLAIDSSLRFLAVVGASGSGKSSLVRAGLAVAIKKAGWDVRIFTPGADPLKALVMQFEMDQDRAGGDRLLILVDQFEETFTLCRDESERISFIERLLGFAQEPSKKMTVVIALRADFYSHCAQYPLLRQAVSAEQEYIGQMNKEELRRAIEEPAKRDGWEFEPGLVDVLLQDIGAHGSHEPESGALPLLSHALLATWERRRGRTLMLDGYYASGGVRGAIAETAESVFTDQLNQTQQELARDVFLRLTELGEGTEDTRRRAMLKELVRQSAEATQLRAVLNTLAEARLITLNEDSAEVAHEALIREWHRLHEWLTEDREGLLLHRHLTESAHEWESRDGDPAELYRGARLAQAHEWASINEERLNTTERAFLAASINQEQHDALEREAQRQRELEAAQELAESQSRAAKQLRRRAISLASALALVLVLAGVAIFFGHQASQNALAAQSRELAAAAISNLDVDPERSILLALQAVSAKDTLEAENALHRSILASRILLVFHHDAEIWSVAYSPDGTRIATASQDKTAKIWDAATGELLLTLSGHSESVNDVIYSPDGTQIATASQDKTAKIWDAASGQLLLTLSGHAESVHAVIYNSDGTRLVTASDDKTARVWDAFTGEELLTFSSHGNAVFNAAFSPDGKRVATSGLDENVRIWDAISGNELLTLPFENGDQLRGLAFSPDGTRIAVTSTRFPWGRVWDATTGEVLLSGFSDHRDVLVDIDFSSDGKLMATGSSDTKAKIWDTMTGEVLYTLSGHTLPVTGVAFNNAGTRLVTVSWDHTARVWDITPASESLFIPIDSPWSLRTSYSPDGMQLLTDYPSEDVAKVKVWDAASGKELLTWKREGDSVFLTAYSPDGSQVAMSSDKNIIVLDAKTGKEQFTLAGHADLITDIGFSPDGSQLASGSGNGEIIIWDMVDGKALLTLQGRTIGSSPMIRYAVFAVAYSPNGNHLISGDTYGMGIIWDITTGEKLFTVLNEEAVGNSSFPDIGFDAAYSPDGKRVALTGGLGTTRIWDASTGKELLVLKGHTGSVVSVTFSSDGKRIATASVDGTVKVWNATTGVNLLTLPVESRGAGGVSFSPDGKRLAVGAVSGVYVFVLPIDDVVELARSRLTRSLTAEECQQYLHVEQCLTEH